MKQVRRSVFETNSSSTHSITITHGKISNNDIHVDRDGYIHTELGDFGWEVCDYRGQAERLSYLVTMLAVKSDVTLWLYEEDENRTDKRAGAGTAQEIQQGTLSHSSCPDCRGRHAVVCKGAWLPGGRGFLGNYRTSS